MVGIQKKAGQGTQPAPSGEMAELADGAALEMLYRRKPVVGSNPTLSAIRRRSSPVLS